MKSNLTCKMITPWDYKCEFPVVEGSEYCKFHKDMKCVVCGNQADHLEHIDELKFNFISICEKCLKKGVDAF